MENPKQLSKLMKIAKIGAITGAVVALASFFIRLVPCSDKGSWKLCALPSLLVDMTETTSKYYGLTNNPITGLFLQFLIPLVLLFLIMLLLKKKRAKVLDLTRR
jgi:glycerol uptake facilitator-like aquaporin